MTQIMHLRRPAWCSPHIPTTIITGLHEDLFFQLLLRQSKMAGVLSECPTYDETPLNDKRELRTEPLSVLVLFCCFFLCQVDNQLIGTTQPFMLYVTPLSNENEVIETGPAVQVNAVKFPSKSALTNIYKVGCWERPVGLAWRQEAGLFSHGRGSKQQCRVCGWKSSCAVKAL